MRQSVHDIEDKLKTMNNPQLAIQMLQMRRSEKDFLARLDNIYVQKVDQAAELFTTKLAGSAISPSEQGA